MRDNSVTYSKGIAIFLMVLGHSLCFTCVESWLNMFHVPIFFFMSGYCFKERYLSDCVAFLRAKVKGIYWPFVKYTTLFILLHNFLFRIGVYNEYCGYKGIVSHQYTATDILLHIKEMLLSMVESERLLGGYWFLTDLFVGCMLFYVVCVICRVVNAKFGGRHYWLGLLLLAVSVVMNLRHSEWWVLNYRVFMSAFFIWCGYVYRQMDISSCVDRLSAGYIYLFAAVCITLGSLFWPGAAVEVVPKYQIFFVVTALIGVVSVFRFSRSLESGERYGMAKRIFVLLGDTSLSILTWHMLCFVLVSQIIVSVYDLPQTRIAEFPIISEYAIRGWWVAYLFVGIVIPVAIDLLGKRFFSACKAISLRPCR